MRQLVARAGACPRNHAGVTDSAARLDDTGAGSTGEDAADGRGPALHHEAVLLPVVGHQDDVAVGSPDEPGQPEGVVGAGRSRLHGRHLVGFNAAQLRR